LPVTFIKAPSDLAAQERPGKTSDGGRPCTVLSSKFISERSACSAAEHRTDSLLIRLTR